MSFRHAAALAIVIASSSAFAAQFGDPDDLLSLEVHGFVSQGFIYTTNGNSYLAEGTNKGSFAFTELGVNFTKQLTDTLRIGFQIFAHNLGPFGNYSVKADWYCLDWRFRDWFGIRVGRVKLPFGLYNDTSDIDAARVPVLLPQSVYSANNRDFLLAQTGIELYGRVRMWSAGALAYNLYGGTVFVDVADDAEVAEQGLLLNYRVPYVFGARLSWELPIEGLRLGGSVQYLQYDIAEQTLTPPQLSVEITGPGVFWVASADYMFHDLLLSAEYGRSVTAVTTSTLPALAPVGVRPDTERAYVMASYHVNPWFTPGVYYSLLYLNAEHRVGRSNEQHDIAGTLRFDINSFWIVKLEGHFMSGTAGLDPLLNQNRPLNTLAPYWGAFFIKTTGYF